MVSFAKPMGMNGSFGSDVQAAATVLGSCVEEVVFQEVTNALDRASGKQSMGIYKKSGTCMGDEIVRTDSGVPVGKSTLTSLNLAIVGETGAGKTSLIKRYCEGRYVEGQLPTVAVDYGIALIPPGTVCGAAGGELHVWDLSGRDDFKLTRREFLHEADAVVIAVDATASPATGIKAIAKWIKRIDKLCRRQPPVVVCATKCDDGLLPSQELIDAALAATASSYSRKEIGELSLGVFGATSARTGEGVRSAIDAVITAAWKVRSTPNTITPDDDTNVQK